MPVSANNLKCAQNKNFLRNFQTIIFIIVGKRKMLVMSGFSRSLLLYC